MSIDQRARRAAESVRDNLDAIVIPEPGAVMQRARRRRGIGVAATALVVVAAVATFVFVRDDATPPPKIQVTGPSVPPGSSVGAWATITKASSGIGSGSSLQALSSDGSTLLLAGERPGNGEFVVMMWWSTDGAHWTEADHPTEHDSVTAIGSHDGTAIAIGAPGGPNAFVWTSHDGGRTWQETARGAVFGASVPNNRPGAAVSGVSWHDGWWIAYGGAADGYEGIWISRDAAKWTLALDSHSSGSIDGVVETTGGSLMAYGVGATASQSTLEIGWFTNDPTEWGASVPIETPGRYYLGSVTAGAELAIGTDIDTHGTATPLLRSTDGGRTWHEDASFSAAFPTAWAWTAETTAGLDVVAGTTTKSEGPKAWLQTAAGAPWTTGPPEDAPPSLPATSIPFIPPKGSLDLVAAAGNRVVFMGRAAELDRYYVFDAATNGSN
jgi:hypothetical protein